MVFAPRIRGIVRRAASASIEFLLLFGVCLAPAVGQGINNRADADNAPDVFVPASRDLQLQLNRAKKAIQEGSFVDAADLLGSLIAVPEAEQFSPEAEDYFLDGVEAGGTFRSLKTEVLKLLGGMPAKGREAYEIRYGADAKVLVDAAVESGDIAKLTEAARMYFHTKAGYEAMLLLARYHYIEGRPLAAALCAQRVVESAGAASSEPEASLVLASAWLSAGYPERARAALIALKKKAPRAQITIEGQPRALFASDAQALDWLKAILPDAIISGSGAQENWVMHRGDPARNAESKGSAPVRTPIWQALPVFDPEDEAILLEVERGYREQPGPAALLSVLHPLAVGDDVIMRLPDKVIALDFETGKAKWEYPWNNSVKSVGPSLEASRNQTNERDRRRQYLTRKIWEDSAQGQLSSDGEQLYFLESASNSAALQNLSRLPQRLGGFGRLEFDMRSSSNTLVCLELQSEGRQKWVVGGVSGEDEIRLAGAWFLGAPLAMQGQVYVLAEMAGEIRLVVLDADTGELQWWQQLCLVDEFSAIGSDTERKISGCTPSFADGVLVCPTSAGAVVAVDIATRSLVWGYRYQTSMQRRSYNFSPQSFREIGKRWTDCTVTIADGKALVCTPDSDELHCLDLVTGKRIWGPSRRADSLYVACVRDETLYLVHSESMTAIRMSDGVSAPAWKAAVSLKGSRPSGRGFVDGHFYYLPVENSQILKIDLLKGEIAERIPTAYALGNLVCHRDKIIAQSTRQWLSLFHQLDPLRDKVKERLAANAKDAWALARQGEILAHDGKPREAIAALKTALEIDPKSKATRSILARTMLALLRTDFAGNPELTREAAKFVDRPEDRAELLQLELNGLINTGALAEAFDRLMLLALDSERPGVPVTGELIEPPGDPARRVTRQRWQRGLLTAMWSKASAELRATMRARFTAEAAKLGKDAGADRLSWYVDLFGGFPGSELPLVQLIKIETSAANYLRAEMLLDLLKQFESVEAQVTAQALTFELAIASSQKDLAADAWSALMTQKEPLTLLDGKPFATWLSTMQAKAASATALTWPTGLVHTDSIEEQTRGIGMKVLAANFRLRPHDSQEPVEISIARTGADSSILVRNRFGMDQVRLELDQLDQRNRNYTDIRQVARVRGNYLLVSQGFQLLAMDLHRSAAESDSVQQWSIDLIPAKSSSFQGAGFGQRTFNIPSRSPLDTAPPRSAVVYSSVDREMGQTSDLRLEGICFHRGFKLVCVAPLTGKVLWERSDIPMGYDLSADEKTLIVCDRDLQMVRRFRLTDGSELAPAMLEEGEKVWTGLGSHVLTSQSISGGNTVVRLWSFADEVPRLAWKEEMPAKSVGCIVDGVEIALLRPDGKLAIFPLDEARPAIRQTLDVSGGVTQLSVQRTANAYYVGVHEPFKATAAPSTIAPVPVRGVDVFHGAMHALDRQSGALLWPSPARIEQNGLVIETAATSPVMVFVKAFRQQSGRVLRTGDTLGAILVIDKATGRSLYERTGFAMQIGAPYCRVEVDPKSKEVNVIVPGKSFGGVTLSFTDEPRPPEPPAQTGSFALSP